MRAEPVGGICSQQQPIVARYATFSSRTGLAGSLVFVDAPCSGLTYLPGTWIALVMRGGCTFSAMASALAAAGARFVACIVYVSISRLTLCSGMILINYQSGSSGLIMGGSVAAPFVAVSVPYDAGCSINTTLASDPSLSASISTPTTGSFFSGTRIASLAIIVTVLVLVMVCFGFIAYRHTLAERLMLQHLRAQRLRYEQLRLEHVAAIASRITTAAPSVAVDDSNMYVHV